MDILNLLNTLTETPGPSGLENDIATVVAEMWRPYVDEVQRDRVGNLVTIKYGLGSAPRKRVLLTAHMDEIALMVTGIETHNQYGFLRVTAIGGIDVRQLWGQRVMVHGQRNLVGVIGSLPNSMIPQERQGKVLGFDDLVVDVGFSAETLKTLVQIGDYITFQQPVHTLLSKQVATKALDNRASIAALTVALAQLQKINHSWDVVTVATVQEETRLLGGQIVGFSQKPDLAVALDVAFAKQPSVSDSGTFPLGSGPILDIGVHVHPAILKALQNSADSLEMKTNLLPHAKSSGTETGVLQLTHAGVPTGLVSIPIRYMHTMVETIALRDIKRTGRLLATFVQQLDDTFMKNLTKSLMPDPN